MENKRKKTSLFFKGSVITLALGFGIMCLPYNAVSLASAALSSTDYTYMTIASVSGQETTVTKGATYKIANGYIGGNTAAVVGKVAKDTELENGTTVTLKSSKVTVSYSSIIVGEIKDGTASGDVAVSAEEGVVGTFDAVKEGNYTVTYSYTYEDGAGKTFTNQYSVKVSTELTSASISVVANSDKFLPDIIDLAQAPNTFKVFVPQTEIKDENGDVLNTSDYTITNSRATAVADKSEGAKYLVVGVVASNGNAVSLTKDAESGLYYFENSVFEDTNYGAGKYTVTYSYYEEGNFITSTTKSTKVYAKNNAYYKDYALKFELASSWSNNGETGVANALPKAKGVTAKTTTPASEEVSVSYTVKVYYKAKSSDSYTVLNADQYNTAYNKANGITDKTSADYEIIVNEDGTLVNAEEFKPMQDGNYSFIYTVKDFYGKTDASTIGLYEWTEVKDKTNPTPVVYDASVYDKEEGYKDASSKLAYYSNPGEVVVYAIGMEDNVSKTTDEGVVLERKIVKNDSTTAVSIKEYNDKNLVFNYGTYETLQTNNYLIRKATSTVSSDADMLDYLNNNGYMIVVDNANYKHIYEVFESVVGAGKSDAEALAYFKTSEAKEDGFAYLDMDKTFGSKATSNTTTAGHSTGLFYVHYIATDAAGNKTDITKNMYVQTFEDSEVPTVKLAKDGLKSSYAKDAEISIAVPTATDTRDSRLEVKTLYRYLNNTTVVDAGDVDFAEVYADLEDADKTKYSAYEGEGYIALTDAESSTYKIKLSSETANKIQIIAYAYDDLGNVGMTATTIAIENIVDAKAPKIEGVEEGTTGSIAQGDEVELPTLTVVDDKVEYLTYDVSVVYTDTEGNETIVSSYNDNANKNVTNLTGFGSYEIFAGKFTAAFAGDYQVKIAVTDLANNTIVSFANYTVEAREVLQNPVIGSTLSSQTVELDENPTIEIPVPTINYELSNSVTYDVYAENGYTTTNKYVVRGVDQNGKATNYFTGGKETKDSLTPKAVGTYTVQYVANVEIYNKDKFTYVEGNAETYELGGYYTVNGTSKKVYVKDETISCEDYKMYKNEDGVVVFETSTDTYTYDAGTFYNENGTVASFTITDSAIADMPEWFKDLRVYKLTSDVYTITVKDSKGPSVKDSTFDYDDQKYMSVEDFKTNGIKILPIEAADASGLNVEKSQVVISWKRADGTASGSNGSKTYTGAQAFEQQVYTVDTTNTTNYDGTYTITYTIYDNAGNSTTKAYTISVGDNEDPTVVVAEDLIEDKYEVGTTFKFDTANVVMSDNKTAKENLTVRVKLVNKTTSDEVEYTVSGTEYTFKELDSVGEYTFTLEVEDEVGHVATYSKTFDITEKSTNPVQVYKVVGIALIVVSVLVLAGVVVYFIVSKVKLDKELKK